MWLGPTHSIIYVWTKLLITQLLLNQIGRYLGRFWSNWKEESNAIIILVIWAIEGEILLQFQKLTYTNKAQPTLHWTCYNWLDHGNTNQEHFLIEDPNVLSSQIYPTPTLRKVAHQGKISVEISPSHVGTQHNGDRSFLSGEYWSRWILVAT